MIGTGGTISGAAPDRMQLAGYKAGTFLIKDMLAQIPELAEIADVTSEQLVNVGSGNIGEKELLMIAKRINTLCAEQPDIAGFVVTHGTGTLDETSYFLDLTVRTDKPVVIVGAMRPWTAISGDGPLNLYNAAQRRDQCRARRHENRHRARSRRSTPASLGSSATPIRTRSSISRTPLFRHTYKSEFDVSKLDKLPKVDIVYGYQDASRAPVDALVAEGARGIITVDDLAGHDARLEGRAGQGSGDREHRPQGPGPRADQRAGRAERHGHR